MRIVLLLLIVQIGFSQADADVSRLLREVADSATNTTEWHIEGSIEYSGLAIRNSSNAQFTLLMRSPNEVRFEESGGPNPAIIVCDGNNAWVYSPPLHRYQKEASPKNTLCSPIVADWRSLPSMLESPVLVGPCGPNPSLEAPANYELVRGSFTPQVATAGRITRTLCINPTRKLIVWEKWESTYSVRTYSYSRLDQKPEFASDTFTFQPPPQSVLTKIGLPAPRPMGIPGMSLGPDISPPRLISKQEPKYGKRSRNEGIQGTVILYVVVAASGVPSDVLVYRQLSPDLDAEAVNAVRKWRFSPATRNGEPTGVPALIEINFRLR